MPRIPYRNEDDPQIVGQLMLSREDLGDELALLQRGIRLRTSADRLLGKLGGERAAPYLGSDVVPNDVGGDTEDPAAHARSTTKAGDAALDLQERGIIHHPADDAVHVVWFVGAVRDEVEE